MIPISEPKSIYLWMVPISKPKFIYLWMVPISKPKSIYLWMVPISKPKSIYLWMVPNGYLNLDGESEWLLVENIDEMLKKNNSPP